MCESEVLHPHEKLHNDTRAKSKDSNLKEIRSSSLHKQNTQSISTNYAMHLPLASGLPNYHHSEDTRALQTSDTQGTPLHLATGCGWQLVNFLLAHHWSAQPQLLFATPESWHDAMSTLWPQPCCRLQVYHNFSSNCDIWYRPKYFFCLSWRYTNDHQSSEFAIHALSWRDDQVEWFRPWTLSPVTQCFADRTDITLTARAIVWEWRWSSDSWCPARAVNVLRPQLEGKIRAPAPRIFLPTHGKDGGHMSL